MTDSHEDCAKCGAILTAQIQKVVCGNGCRECGRYAFRADQPSYLYLLTNEQLRLHKIGIGTVGKDRNHMQQLIQAGWRVNGIWHESDKHTTFRWEEEIFKQLTAKFDATNAEQLGFIGRRDRHWVESISSQAISIIDLAELMSTVVSSKVK